MDGKPYAEMRSKVVWGEKPHPTWNYRSAISYICAPDKKEWRKYYGDFDKDVSPEDFSEIQDEYGRSLGVVDEVVVQNPPFICPQTGVVWTPKNRELVESKKLWLFKLFPESREGIWWVEYPVEFHRSKTAFLSGRAARSFGIYGYQGYDYRKFLYTNEKINKMDIIKSAARKFKRMRIRPIPQATINFFKTLGAITHLNKRKPKTVKQ